MPSINKKPDTWRKTWQTSFTRGIQQMGSIYK